MSRNPATPIIAAERFVNEVADALKSLGVMGQPIAVAVSGGADSTSLLLSLHTLSCRERFELAAVHANHELRGEDSDADERFVRQLCQRLEIRLVCQRLPVPLDAAQRQEGIEVTARELRQRFFLEASRELNVQFVATAHTADDQVETVLHRIVRGTSLAGLTGIPRRRELAPGVHLIRPLLGLRRSDVLVYLQDMGQSFCEDRTNLELNYTRNRIRHELLPYLERHFNPQVREAVLRLTTLAGDYQSAIDAEVQSLVRRAVVKERANHVRLRTAPFRKSPSILIRESMRRIWIRQGWPLQELGQQELEHLAALVLSRARHQTCQFPGGVTAKRGPEHLVLERRK